MDYPFLKEIIGRLEQFDRERGGQSAAVEDFARWILLAEGQRQTQDDPSQSAQHRWRTQRTALEKDISMYLVFLNRYARMYTKKALEGSALTTTEEFSYLAMLMEQESATKSELILMNKQEKTSGTEVIKRLLAAGLIEQFDDPRDRRSRRVRITHQGRQAIFGIFEPMLLVSHLVCGNLTQAEKRLLVDLLRKLNHFHEPIFREQRDAPLQALASHLPPTP